MSDSALREKYAHRFRVHDADGDGFVAEQDVVARAERLIAALGEDPSAEPARAALARARAFWQGLVAYSGDGSAGRLDEKAFVDALERAREAGVLGELVEPSVRAHVALVDRDGDGAVSLEEFVTSQQAMGQTASAAREAFAALDGNGDGVVSAEEWLQAVVDFYTVTGRAAAPGDRILGLR